MLFNPVFRLSLAWLAPVLALLASSFSSPLLANDSGGVPELRMAETVAPVVPADQPMMVVRMRGTGRCGSLCPEWIMAQGLITPNTPERFRLLLRQMGHEKLPVVLDSPGGDLDAALDIGRMIRAKGLTTIIGRSEAQGCAPCDAACHKGRPVGLVYKGFVSTPGACAGACLLVLAAGTQRIGYWITESAFPAPDSYKTSKAGSDAATLIGDYLADMGISPGLMPRVRRSSLPLDRAEMLHFGLSTGRQRVEDFTGSSICAGARPAANCVALAPAKPPARMSATAPARKPTMPRTNRVIIWGGIEDM